MKIRHFPGLSVGKDLMTDLIKRYEAKGKNFNANLIERYEAKGKNLMTDFKI